MTRGDGLENEGESAIKGGDMTAVFWVQQCQWGKDATGAGGLMRLMGMLEDRREWCLQTKHLKGLIKTPADGLTRWDPCMLTEELTEGRPDAN